MSKHNTQALLRNAPLVGLTVTVSVSLEAFGWGYIFMTNHAHSDVLGLRVPLALVEAIIISATGILALIAAFVAAERRQDARPSERNRAGAAQVLALALLIPPVVKAAESFAFPGQVDASNAYRASEEYRANLAASQDSTLDSVARRQAAVELSRATPPVRAKFDLGAWAWAGFLYGANMAAASFLWRAQPETPAQRERRERQAYRERNRARRDRIKLAELEAISAANKAAHRPGWFRGLFTAKAA